MRIRFVVGEYTTWGSQMSGLLPNQVCGHRHLTRHGADKCASFQPYPWVHYIEVNGNLLRDEHQNETELKEICELRGW